MEESHKKEYVFGHINTFNWFKCHTFDFFFGSFPLWVPSRLTTQLETPITCPDWERPRSCQPNYSEAQDRWPIAVPHLPHWGRMCTNVRHPTVGRHHSEWDPSIPTLSNQIRSEKQEEFYFRRHLTYHHPADESDVESVGNIDVQVPGDVMFKELM